MCAVGASADARVPLAAQAWGTNKLLRHNFLKAQHRPTAPQMHALSWKAPNKRQFKWQLLTCRQVCPRPRRSHCDFITFEPCTCVYVSSVVETGCERVLYSKPHSKQLDGEGSWPMPFRAAGHTPCLQKLDPLPALAMKPDLDDIIMRSDMTCSGKLHSSHTSWHGGPCSQRSPRSYCQRSEVDIYSNSLKMSLGTPICEKVCFVCHCVTSGASQFTVCV
jgi:hypothetical protein